MTEERSETDPRSPVPKGTGRSPELVIPAWIADVVICLVLAALGLWFVMKSLPMPPGRTMIGPGTFPRYMGLLLIGLCLAQMAASVLRRGRGSVVAGRPLMVGIAIVMVLLFPTAMERLGYYLAAAIWVPVFAWVAGMREVGAFVVITVVILGLARFVFEGLLGTPLS